MTNRRDILKRAAAIMAAAFTPVVFISKLFASQPETTEFMGKTWEITRKPLPPLPAHESFGMEPIALDQQLQAIKQYSTEEHEFVKRGLELYGSVYLSVRQPFARHLRCYECHGEWSLDTVRYDWASCTFTDRCLYCGHQGICSVVDRAYSDVPLRVSNWHPEEIVFAGNQFTNETNYYWKIPQHVTDEVKNNNAFLLRRLPWSVLQTIQYSNSPLFQFRPGIICHIRPGHYSWVGSGMMNDLRIGDLNVKQA